jgi:hypothetical protein
LLCALRTAVVALCTADGSSCSLLAAVSVTTLILPVMKLIGRPFIMLPMDDRDIGARFRARYTSVSYSQIEEIYLIVTSNQWLTQKFFGGEGESTNSVDRGQIERGSGGDSPLVMGSN